MFKQVVFIANGIDSLRNLSFSGADRKVADKLVSVPTPTPFFEILLIMINRMVLFGLILYLLK